jgi:hypothetical protein
VIGRPGDRESFNFKLQIANFKLKCGMPLQYLVIVITIIAPGRIYDVNKEQENDCENGEEPRGEVWS